MTVPGHALNPDAPPERWPAPWRAKILERVQQHGASELEAVDDVRQEMRGFCARVNAWRHPLALDDGPLPALPVQRAPQRVAPQARMFGGAPKDDAERRAAILALDPQAPLDPHRARRRDEMPEPRAAPAPRRAPARETRERERQDLDL